MKLSLVVYLLAAFGLAYIIGQSLITRRLREWAWDVSFGVRKVIHCERCQTNFDPATLISRGQCPSCSEQVDISSSMRGFFPFRIFIQLIECPACFGFWTGLVGSLVVPTHSAFFPDFPLWLAVLVTGCMTTASNLLLAKLAGLMPADEE